MNLIIGTIFFASFGMLTEVLFRSGKDVFLSLIKREKINWSLPTTIYAWMIPIYGSAFILFRIFYEAAANLGRPIQILIVTVSIFIIEYLSGFLLKKLTGKCPWEYSKGMHIHGFIRLDYAPFWMLFSYLLIVFYEFFVNLLY
ncbi:MAG: hypothetical protein ACI865_001207 [Flavobacteriaceae bacterium]|jgi:hypothetical protein